MKEFIKINLSDERFSIIEFESKKIITINNDNKSYVILQIIEKNYIDKFGFEISGYVEIDILSEMCKLGFIIDKNEINILKNSLSKDNFPGINYLYPLVEKYYLDKFNIH